MHHIARMITAGGLFISGLFLTALACGTLLNPAPAGQPADLPLATPVATETTIPLYQQVTLVSVPGEEQGGPYGYTIKTLTPSLRGSLDPRVTKFNDEMKAIVEKAVSDFRTNLANLQPTPVSGSSFFEQHYSVLSPAGNILSLKFDIQTYYTGAAHPGDVSQTLTYDLEQGRDLALGDLFLPGADYLTPISKYCITQLSTRDISFQGFELGATATPANYRNWNITPDGLMITFDEYQVAPYAAGPQSVVIPYKDLAQFLQPTGPLAKLLH